MKKLLKCALCTAALTLFSSLGAYAGTNISLYDFDKTTGTLATSVVRRSCADSVVSVTTLQTGNKALHFSLPNVETDEKTPYIYNYQRLNDAAFAIQAGAYYIFSMDVKTDCVNPANNFRLFNWQQNKFEAGFIYFKCGEAGGGEDMTVNFMHHTTNQTVGSADVRKDEFFNVKAVLDGNTKTYDLYCNDTKINAASQSLAEDISEISLLVFRYHFAFGSGDINAWFDNISIEKIDCFGVESTSIPGGGVVDPLSDSIKLVFSEAVDASTLSNIVLTDEEDSTVKTVNQLGGDGKTVTVSFVDGLRANTDYTLTTAGVRGRLVPIESEHVASFSTADGVNVTPPVITDEHGEEMTVLKTGSVSAHIYADNRRYGGDVSTVTLMMAYYDNDKLINVVGSTLDNLSEKAQRIEVSMDVEDSSFGHYIKVFVLDSYNAICPLRYGVRLVGY